MKAQTNQNHNLTAIQQHSSICSNGYSCPCWLAGRKKLTSFKVSRSSSHLPDLVYLSRNNIQLNCIIYTICIMYNSHEEAILKVLAIRVDKILSRHNLHSCIPRQLHEVSYRLAVESLKESWRKTRREGRKTGEQEKNKKERITEERTLRKRKPEDDPQQCPIISYHIFFFRISWYSVVIS